MSDFSVVLLFDTNDAEFRRGVEIGMLYERLAHVSAVDAAVHADCAEMIIRVAEARGLPFTAESFPAGDDGWLCVTIGGE